ncbi:2Fe-2S iron-sulfur cluster binding domain-containing protein [Herbaspirillum seropedicae]|uniref:2Fe-2S iron-sulfur cluster binding domain-containing protein n=1 Tax=Herbaspirillum seropedicae TaxID=964 RepID=UPI002864CBF9|nr:2Fe-2S iron-sulfur cluster binding domain-containing protein [Herbaspirillum seropedicae]MDR6397483.1 3-phenylpropionate/trans-cinnamate dioxygenase ferredoxin reductase subunit/benzoate/toluate 1,2-dioxygenase reductase subunit [Herbaspirillum seropedicae]
MNVIPITLLFADGVAHRLEVSAGGKLIEAATDAGLNLLTDCSNGQCGTCTASLLSGHIEMDDYDTSVLPDSDRECGAILPCVSRINSSCVVEFPYDSSEALAEEASPIDGVVAAVQQVAAEIMQLTIDIEEELFFEPGQYVRLHPEGTEISRSYSMANAPGARQLEFFIRQVPGGAFSGWLSQAKAGDKVKLSTPHGTFFLRDEERPRLFVAGGSGIAPFLSMLRGMSTSARALPTTVLIGARTPEHLFALDELKALGRIMPQLDVRLAVEQGAFGDSHAGYPTDLIAALGLDVSTRVYLCGPPPMVEAGRTAAQNAGIARGDVLCERFN